MSSSLSITTMPADTPANSATTSSATTSSPAKTTWRFKIISALLAFGLWGGWAYYVNSKAAESMAAESAVASAQHAPPLVSALLQGTGSFSVTFVMVAAVSWLYRQFPKNIWQIILPGVITVVVTASCFITIHFLVGTANIPRTVAPALTVAICFCLFITLKLRRIENLESQTEPGATDVE